MQTQRRHISVRYGYKAPASLSRHLFNRRNFPVRRLSCTFGSFGWDNEYGTRELDVPSFEASKHMVSNGEYMAFVADAGYARRELWTENGWGWKMFRNVKCPHFWIPEVRETVRTQLLVSCSGTKL